MKKVKIAITIVIMMVLISARPIASFANFETENNTIENIDRKMTFTNGGEYLVHWSGTSNVYHVIAKTLNVRDGAGENYSIIGILSYNDMPLVHSISNGWAKITYNNQIGYVEAEYLEML